ncbi:MAG: hypothetical protein VX733_00605 [Candidatus Latescibacterota bacterium]|nr:hypothetical protein [Candidatus Latescibacterota bacterium]
MPDSTHIPCFHVHTEGGETAGQEWICDGDEKIARLAHDIVGQPEQNLRYFDRNPRPWNLRWLRLRPGGRPLVAGVQMFWNLGGQIITTEVNEVCVSGGGSEVLTLEVVSQDPGGVATSRRQLRLTYDADLDSYCYDFVAHLDLHSPEVFAAPGVEEVRFEYSDPWYCDIPRPTVEFAGMWPGFGYRHLLAEEADGSVWQMPLNHMATGIPAPQSFKENGLLGLALDPGTNPAFEFLGDTASRTAVGVCNWGYDVHLTARYAVAEIYQPICERFRIRLCGDEKAKELNKQAKPVPAVLYAGFEELPLYSRSSSFERGLRLTEPTQGDTDPWPWLPSGDEAEWCRDTGRTDDYSLKLSRIDPGVSEWTMDREGDGAFTQVWRQAEKWSISVYAKTESISGRGAYLAVRWFVYNYEQCYPYVKSEALTGTHSWTRLIVEIEGSPPPESSAICLSLRLDGAGTVFFDDLEVRPSTTFKVEEAQVA